MSSNALLEGGKEEREGEREGWRETERERERDRDRDRDRETETEKQRVEQRQRESNILVTYRKKARCINKTIFVGGNKVNQSL